MPESSPIEIEMHEPTPQELLPINGNLVTNPAAMVFKGGFGFMEHGRVLSGLALDYGERHKIALGRTSVVYILNCQNAEKMNTMSTAKAIPLIQRGARLQPRFYIGVTLMMGILVVTGFWATYFGPLVRGTIAQPLLIHVHATIFVGWLALFLAQSTLAATGHVDWHLKLGRAGIGYGFLLIAVGLFTTVMRSAEQVLAGENGARLLYVGFFDMTLFSIFFGAAVGLRRKPELHRRLMLIAATVLLVAAVGRIPFLRNEPWGIHLRLLVWSSPILLAIAHDLYKQRRFHLVYAFGMAALIVRLHSVPLSQTEMWTAFCRMGDGAGTLISVNLHCQGNQELSHATSRWTASGS